MFALTEQYQLRWHNDMIYETILVCMRQYPSQLNIYMMLSGWGTGSRRRKEAEWRKLLEHLLPNQIPLHNLLVQWQNTRKFSVLQSSQYNKWINWRQALKELFANGHHARVTHAMQPAEFLSWVQKIQIDAPPKRVYINLHFIH